MSVFSCPFCGLLLKEDTRGRVTCPGCKREINKSLDYYAPPKRIAISTEAPADPVSPAVLDDTGKLSSAEICNRFPALTEAAEPRGIRNHLAYLAALSEVNCMQSKRFETLCAYLERGAVRGSADAADCAAWFQYVAVQDLSDFDRCDLLKKYLKENAGKFSSLEEVSRLIASVENLDIIGVDDVKKDLIGIIVTECISPEATKKEGENLRLMEAVRLSPPFVFDEERKAALFQYILTELPSPLPYYCSGIVLLDYLNSLRLNKTASAALIQLVLEKYAPAGLSLEAYLSFAKYLRNDVRRFQYLFRHLLKFKGDVMAKRAEAYRNFADDSFHADDMLLLFDMAEISCRERGAGAAAFSEIAEERLKTVGNATYSHAVAENAANVMQYLSDKLGEGRVHGEHTPESCPDSKRSAMMERRDSTRDQHKKKGSGAFAVVLCILLLFAVIGIAIWVGVGGSAEKAAAHILPTQTACGESLAFSVGAEFHING